MSLCLAKNCRFSSSHSTCAHKCGKCHQLGHGQVECGDEEQIKKLVENPLFSAELKDNWCCIPSCKNRKTHVLESHNCELCGGNHSKNTCKKNPKYDIYKNDPEINNEMTEMTEYDLTKYDKIDGKIWFEINVGMGCAMYFRRDGLGKRCDMRFMHSDDWGQYGEHTSHTPYLDNFINGYKHVE